MKAIFLAFAFLALVGFGMYQSGWLSMPDPKLEVKNIQTNVTPGMDWKQVVQIAPPRKVTPHSTPLSKVASAPIEFKPSLHEQWINDGNYPYGFSFEYHFSQSDAIAVVFDDKGTVTNVHSLFTAGDLFK